MGGTELDKEGREAMLGDERGKRGNRQLANRRNQNFLSGKPSGEKTFSAGAQITFITRGWVWREGGEA